MHERTISHPILYLARAKIPEEPSLFVDFLETFEPNTRELWIHGTVAAPVRDASEQHLLAHFVLDSAEPVINRLIALPLQKILGDRWGGKGGATLTIEARVTQRGVADPGLTYPAQASAAFAVLQVAFDEVGKLKIDHAVMTDEASSDFTSYGTLDLAQLEIRDDHAVIVVTAPRYMPELEWPAVYIEKGSVAFTIIDRPRGTPLSVLFPLREWDGNGLLRFTLRGLYADQYGARTFESKQVALTLHDTGLK
jgi:hypothetical protein